MPVVSFTTPDSDGFDHQQRDLDFPPKIVAERVNSSITIINKYYDHATDRERMEERRHPYIEHMRFEQ
ncbi:MAG: hypothetical protein ABEH65_04920 [Halobacteriales archaeon]